MDAAVSEDKSVQPLTAGQLCRPADLSSLTFSTTAELRPVDGLVGQGRAVAAILMTRAESSPPVPAL